MIEREPNSKRLNQRVLAGIIMLALVVAACGQEEGVAEQADVLSVDASTHQRALAVAPASVDPLVWKRLDDQSRDIVIVALVNPHEPQAFAPSWDMPGETRDVQREADPQVLADLAARKQRVLRALEDAGQPAEVYAMYDHFALMAIHANRAQVTFLTSLPEVDFIDANRLVYPTLSTSVPFTGGNTRHSAMHTGNNTAVAVIDTPVQYWNGSFGNCGSSCSGGGPNSNSSCAVKAWQNFTSANMCSLGAMEEHGTNVAGIVQGMAPDVDLLSLNAFVFDTAQNRPVAATADIISALNWTATNAASRNVVAVNLSLGSSGVMGSSACNNNNSTRVAMSTLWTTHNVLSVVAAGNDSSTNAFPACITLGVVVMAQYDTDLSAMGFPGCEASNPSNIAPGNLICFSNYNGMFDLVAPGFDITAAGYTLSGTSMAAPHVAGAIATLQSFYVSTTGMVRSIDQLRHELMLDALPKSYTPFGTSLVASELNLDTTQAPANVGPSGSFGRFNTLGTTNRIGGTGSPFQASLNGSSLMGNVAGVYLSLEIVHPSPQDVRVTLTTPNGTSANFTLPANQSNFNAVVGRTYLPNAFNGLLGVPMSGTWSVTIEDTVSGNRGHLMDSRLYLVNPTSCTPVCSATRVCGPDGCGGSCGTCSGSTSCDNTTGQCVCTPNCSGRACGADGCGGTCGTCPTGSACVGGQCFCQPDCTGKTCGDDGCGGSCGTCAGTNDVCSGGQCVCVPNCSGRTCGIDGCGGSCGTCVPGFACVAGQCFCQPDCTGKVCGDDGCGGSCGMCNGGTCSNGQCTGACTPDCTGKMCGSDGCNGTCGTCASGETCSNGQCMGGCVPDCNGKTCGPDGCGSTCGSCAAGEVCAGGQCACVPDCNGKTCGPDGCGGTCGACAPGTACVSGACLMPCTPDCTGKVCGEDGCGGSCGACTGNDSCVDGQCMNVCVPDCSGKMCGNDGCGGSCGPCAAPTPLCSLAGQCVACLDDGDCPSDATCDQGACVPVGGGEDMTTGDAGEDMMSEPDMTSQPDMSAEPMIMEPVEVPDTVSQDGSSTPADMGTALEEDNVPASNLSAGAEDCGCATLRAKPASRSWPTSLVWGLFGMLVFGWRTRRRS